LLEETSTVSTSSRKSDHLQICVEKDVEFIKTNGFERYEFEAPAVPGLNPAGIDTSVEFLGRVFDSPFFIEAMTGGTPDAQDINRNLARAAQKLNIGMGLGSQRPMWEDPSLTGTYSVRDVAPDIFLLSNIGAANLPRFSIDDIAAMVRSVEADGLAVHLNPVQEMVQAEGDRDWTDVPQAIERICRGVDFPVIIKEVGCGISGPVAKLLERAGAACLDVAGAGGTCFARVEHYRGSDSARSFFEWGIPTAESLRICREAVDIPLIASGGIRTGVECAKALAMGASLVGFALPLLVPAMESERAVIERIGVFAEELRKAMLLVGAQNIDQLRRSRIVAYGQRQSFPHGTPGSGPEDDSP
jgi:isopentenyl-diphosphate delta-isomerase